MIPGIFSFFENIMIPSHEFRCSIRGEIYNYHTVYVNLTEKTILCSGLYVGSFANIIVYRSYF